MEKFEKYTGVAAPMEVDDVDTDQIIPVRFCSGVDKSGLDAALFADWRESPEFVLNIEPFTGSSVLVAGENFGCGSSREHAPVAIKASGISCVIAKSFARIFYRNAINIGLPILECPAASEAIAEGDTVSIDFDTGVITDETTGRTFQAAPFPPFIQNIIAKGGLMNSLKD